MKHYKTPVTIELLKKHNPIFFSHDTVKFHGDAKYEISDNGTRLRVVNNLTGVAYYDINEDDYTLSYSR